MYLLHLKNQIGGRGDSGKNDTHKLIEGRCVSEDDYGFNSVKKGKVLFDENSGKEYIEDKCLDEETLLEYKCEYYGRDGEENKVKEVEVKCPYGCSDGKCNLGSKSKFCFGSLESECVDINENTAVECSWRGVSSDRKSQIKIYQKDDSGNSISSKRLDDKCIDSTKKLTYTCEKFINQGEYWEEFKIPKVEILSCNKDSSCYEGICFEDEKSILENLGDVNNDGILNNHDINEFNVILELEEYDEKVDIDLNGKIDTYDLYRLEKMVSGNLGKNVEAQLRNFKLTSQELISRADDDTFGTLVEYSGNTLLTSWNVEFKRKGASRRECEPPMIKVNLKDVKKNQRLLGFSSTSGSLRYDEFKLLADCDIEHNYPAQSLIKEYFIYWIFRKFGISTVDVIAFANVSFDTNDNWVNKSKEYRYILLQNDMSDKDQVPFMNQFDFSKIIEANSEYRAGNWNNDMNSNRYYNITFTKDNGVTNETYIFEINNTITYLILSAFTSLSDRSILHNEDYGIIGGTETIKHIPFDFDLSFDSGWYSDNELYTLLSYVPEEKKIEYRRAIMRITREIFDNPDNLNEMLLAIDRFPFKSNKVKFKDEIKNSFYNAALRYGSKDFADSMQQPFVPFINMG